MGRHIIQQPDGKFCIFSTYIDQIMYRDKTAEEVVEICVEEAANIERERVTTIVTELAAGSRNPNFYSRITYEEAEELHKLHSEESRND